MPLTPEHTESLGSSVNGRIRQREDIASGGRADVWRLPIQPAG